MRWMAWMCLAIVPGVASAECRLTEKPATTERKGECVLTTHQGQVADASAGKTYDLSEVVLTCGALHMGNWTQKVAAALETCKGDMDPTQSFEEHDLRTVVTQWKNLVTIDEESSGYTGGAHPYVGLQRRTYDTRTGKPVDLKSCFPKQHEKLLKAARADFEKADKGEYKFTFDEQGFALDVGKKKTTIRFLFPHGAEVFRGQVHKTTLTARGEPACAAKDVR